MNDPIILDQSIRISELEDEVRQLLHDKMYYLDSAETRRLAVNSWRKGCEELEGRIKVLVEQRATAEASKIEYVDMSFVVKTDNKTTPMVPVGTVMPYTGAEPPEGWALCDGSSVDIPNLRGR